MEGRITRQRKGERCDETTESGKKSGRSQRHLEPTKPLGDVEECVFWWRTGRGWVQGSWDGAH